MLYFACVFKFGPSDTLGSRVKGQGCPYACFSSHPSCCTLPLFLTSLVILSTGGKEEIASLDALGFRPRDSVFRWVPWTHLTYPESCFSGLPPCLCIAFLFPAMGIWPFWTNNLVLFRKSQSPFISAQPHLHYTPFSVASSLAVTLRDIWALFGIRSILLNTAEYIAHIFFLSRGISESGK